MLAGLTLALAIGVLLLPPIPQDPAYHSFADRRTLLGLPNFLNVLSNLPFALVGVVGFWLVSRAQTTPAVPFADPRERGCYAIFFLGVALTGLGSAYYHLAPDNPRLVWDRLPMTLAFMSIFAAIIAERIDSRWGWRLLLPLLLAGVASVFYWHLGESRGAGDLRFYALVQFYPMLVIPLLLWWCPPRYSHGGELAGALGLYGVAKILELLDEPIFAAGWVVSGHTLKHLAAAGSAYWVLRVLVKRREIKTGELREQ
jgi:hypothetical protein